MDLDELKRLVAAATPGPWGWSHFGEKSNNWHAGTYSDKDGKPVAGGPIEEEVYNKRTRKFDGAAMCVEYICYKEDARGFADPALIVAAVNALPDLIARIERLETALRQISRQACTCLAAEIAREGIENASIEQHHKCTQACINDPDWPNWPHGSTSMMTEGLHDRSRRIERLETALREIDEMPPEPAHSSKSAEMRMRRIARAALESAK